MDNCRKAYVSSKLQEEILNLLLKSSELAELMPLYQDLWSLPGSEVAPCMECPSCYDYIFFRKLLNKVKNESPIDRDHLRKELHIWKITQLQDSAVGSIKKGTQSGFNYVKYTAEKEIVYFDQNMLSDYDQNKKVEDEVESLKSKYEFCYSPSHLEEINKVLNPEDVSRLLLKITELTGNIIVFPGAEDYFLAKEEPKYGLERVRSFPGSTESIESLKLVSSSTREIFLKKYDDEIHKKSIGNSSSVFEDLSDEAFNELLVHTHSLYRNKLDIKVHKNGGDLLHAIYTLFNALDLLSFKIDNKDRTIKSSAHDIEHIIYATKAKYFVTKDKNLFHRAKQIFNFLGIDTIVLNHKNYFSHLKVT